MSEQDVEALAEVLRVVDDDALVRTNFGQIVATYDESARAILASDWLAAHVAAARAVTRDQVAAALRPHVAWYLQYVPREEHIWDWENGYDEATSLARKMADDVLAIEGRETNGGQP